MSDPTTTRGLQLPCPKCNEQNANVSLHLDDAETFTCHECEDEFSIDDVREYLATAQRWGRVLDWVQTMPGS